MSNPRINVPAVITERYLADLSRQLEYVFLEDSSTKITNIEPSKYPQLLAILDILAPGLHPCLNDC